MPGPLSSILLIPKKRNLESFQAHLALHPLFLTSNSFEAPGSPVSRFFHQHFPLSKLDLLQTRALVSATFTLLWVISFFYLDLMLVRFISVLFRLCSFVKPNFMQTGALNKCLTLTLVSFKIWSYLDKTSFQPHMFLTLALSSWIFDFIQLVVPFSSIFTQNLLLSIETDIKQIAALDSPIYF